jgi:hypothetical protein
MEKHGARRCQHQSPDPTNQDAAHGALFWNQGTHEREWKVVTLRTFLNLSREVGQRPEELPTEKDSSREQQPGETLELHSPRPCAF